MHCALSLGLQEMMNSYTLTYEAFRGYQERVKYYTLYIYLQRYVPMDTTPSGSGALFTCFLRVITCEIKRRIMRRTSINVRDVRQGSPPKRRMECCVVHLETFFSALTPATKRLPRFPAWIVSHLNLPESPARIVSPPSTLPRCWCHFQHCRDRRGDVLPNPSASTCCRWSSRIPPCHRPGLEASKRRVPRPQGRRFEPKSQPRNPPRVRSVVLHYCSSASQDTAKTRVRFQGST